MESSRIKHGASSWEFGLSGYATVYVGINIEPAAEVASCISSVAASIRNLES